jgi:hypothetical protein
MYIFYDLTQNYIKVKKKRIIYQFNVISMYLTAYRIVKRRKKNKRTYTYIYIYIYIHIHHPPCKRNKILKTSRWIVYMHTLFDIDFIFT